MPRKTHKRHGGREKQTGRDRLIRSQSEPILPKPNIYNKYHSTTKKQKQTQKHKSPYKTQKQEYTIDVETLPHIEAIPVFTLERLEVLGDDNTVMRPKHTILFFEMPSFRGSDKSSSQKGGTDVCEELTEKDKTILKNDIFTRHLYDCKVDNTKKKIILERDGKRLRSFGKGGFNAVFDNDDFDECKGKQYIIRVSIRPIDTTTPKGQSIIDEYIKETRLGIIAAEAGIGPKIYKIGIMRNVDNLDEVYFYSIIERITGYEIGRMIDKGNFNIAADLDLVSGTLDQCIEKLKRAGSECGWLLMDAKPPNAMVTVDDIDEPSSVYLVDFDPGFILETTPNTDLAEMYGIINVLLFLCHSYVHYGIRADASELTYKHRIIDKIGEYYFKATGTMDYASIRKKLQELYLENRQFTSICHHYSYVESDLLHIMYLKLYENIQIKQLFAYVEDSKPVGCKGITRTRTRTRNGLVPFLFFKHFSDNKPNFMVQGVLPPDITDHIVVFYENPPTTPYTADTDTISIYTFKQLHILKTFDKLTEREQEERCAALQLSLDMIQNNVNGLKEEREKMTELMTYTIREKNKKRKRTSKTRATTAPASSPKSTSRIVRPKPSTSPSFSNNL